MTLYTITFDDWNQELVRPWSVDSLDGGSTDAMKIPPIEK